ncbi:hypothetical protein ACFFIF_08565 [Vagococcus entomophilus]|uniref:Uncharacterized protein n=1 Tax=Vagococcus entomophilus TaxID=1160095 RepID=A0A430AGZ9_9ENTE|nr:hypothetical protein [Vagococcus entomophilus]RSU07185.1 hypothetical protein CBF30_08000 [Vagococcus entomophilus]
MITIRHYQKSGIFSNKSTGNTFIIQIRGETKEYTLTAFQETTEKWRNYFLLYYKELTLDLNQTDEEFDIDYYYSEFTLKSKSFERFGITVEERKKWIRFWYYSFKEWQEEQKAQLNLLEQENQELSKRLAYHKERFERLDFSTEKMLQDPNSNPEMSSQIGEKNTTESQQKRVEAQVTPSERVANLLLVDLDKVALQDEILELFDKIRESSPNKWVKMKESCYHVQKSKIKYLGYAWVHAEEIEMERSFFEKINTYKNETLEFEAKIEEYTKKTIFGYKIQENRYQQWQFYLKVMDYINGYLGESYQEVQL